MERRRADLQSVLDGERNEGSPSHSVQEMADPPTQLKGSLPGVPKVTLRRDPEHTVGSGKNLASSVQELFQAP